LAQAGLRQAIGLLALGIADGARRVILEVLDDAPLDVVLRSRPRRDAAGGSVMSVDSGGSGVGARDRALRLHGVDLPTLWVTARKETNA
jgi:hypothetical protein